MKALIAIVLVATSFPVVAGAAIASDSVGRGSAERRICREVTGRSSASRMSPRRVCKTASQWRALEEGTVADDMEDLDTLSHTNGRPVPDVLCRSCTRSPQ